MRIWDWMSAVCSSDLPLRQAQGAAIEFVYDTLERGPPPTRSLPLCKGKSQPFDHRIAARNASQPGRDRSVNDRLDIIAKGDVRFVKAQKTPKLQQRRCILDRIRPRALQAEINGRNPISTEPGSRRIIMIGGKGQYIMATTRHFD